MGRIEVRDDIIMTNPRKGDASSEEYILQDDKTLYIRKTVGYSVEYSGEHAKNGLDGV
jgi:hypothetical protein